MEENRQSILNHENIENFIHSLEMKIDYLKVQYNLFFQRELKIPPEKERESLENSIRNLQYSGKGSARGKILIQNISSKFTLYNNMWLKRLNEIETGLITIQRKKSTMVQEIQGKKEKTGKLINVSLNNEESFEKFYKTYNSLNLDGSANAGQKEKIINKLKTRLISANLIDAQVNLFIDNGKIKIKLKE